MFSSTRSISLSEPERVTLPSLHVANPTANAMVLFDLNQDGHNELVLGLTDGWLAVYKGRKQYHVATLCLELPIL
jgi:hypothetical protein